jgi:small subunit ribosomal protein S24e
VSEVDVDAHCADITSGVVHRVHRIHHLLPYRVQFSTIIYSPNNPPPSQQQMIVDIIHPGRANVAKSELQGVIGGMHKTDAKLVVLFGFRTKFGGGKSTGFCVIYDNEDALMKFEPKHRLVRQGLAEKKETSRKAIKEAKNKGLKIRGTGASIAKHKAKRAANAD